MVDLVYDVQAVHPLSFKHGFCGQGAGGPHIGVGRVQQQALLCKCLAVLLFDGQGPVLLAGGVQVVAVTLQCGLHDGPAQLHKRAGHVDDHINFVKQWAQFLGGIVGNRDLSIDRRAVALFHDFQCIFQTGLVAARHIEGDIALGKGFGDQFAGVTAGAVYENFSFVGHGKCLLGCFCEDVAHSKAISRQFECGAGTFICDIRPCGLDLHHGIRNQIIWPKPCKTCHHTR